MKIEIEKFQKFLNFLLADFVSSGENVVKMLFEADVSITTTKTAWMWLWWQDEMRVVRSGVGSLIEHCGKEKIVWSSVLLWLIL